MELNEAGTDLKPTITTNFKTPILKLTPQEKTLQQAKRFTSRQKAKLLAEKESCSNHGLAASVGNLLQPPQSATIHQTKLCQVCRQKKAHAKMRLVNSVKLQKLKFRKEKKKLKHLQSKAGRRKLKKKAEALLHEYIRRRAVGDHGLVQCYSCYKLVDFSKTNAGHFRHGKLDLDERNLKAQCISCNLWKSGELGRYALHLVEDYGKEWVDKLNQDADRDTGVYTYDFLLQTIKHYTEILKVL